MQMKKERDEVLKKIYAELEKTKSVYDLYKIKSLIEYVNKANEVK